MIHFDYEGKKYGIQWWYEEVPFKSNVRDTHCEIFLYTDNEERESLADGVAMLHEVDIHKFTKNDGRMISLAKALTTFNKVFRGLAWRAYWNRSDKTSFRTKIRDTTR
jgi:hypothetical protein